MTPLHLLPATCVCHHRNPDGTMMSTLELIDTGTDKLYVCRDEDGKFEERVYIGKSLSADSRHKAKQDAKPGEGDKGDQKARS